MLITEEPFQTLEYREYNEGVGIVEKNKVNGEWVTKTTLLHQGQALKIAYEILKTYKYTGGLK